MFDTHCHLNFKAFKNGYDQVISNALKVGVENIIIPGTDIETSKKAVEIAEKYDGVYAAVGIHPHHVYENHKSKIKSQSFDVAQDDPERSRMGQKFKSKVKNIVGAQFIAPESGVGVEFSDQILELETLINHPKVVAVGEVGLDKHQYQNTKYETYLVDDQFIEVQKELLIKQIKLAVKYHKTLILHNREAKK